MSSLAMFQNELILQKEDRRQPVSPFNLRNFPYNCIGRIGVYNDQLGGIQCGTGFLISSSLILTSAHNLEALSEKAMPQDCQQIEFTIYDYMNGAAVKSQYSIESYRICSQYRPTENKLVALQLQYNQEPDKAKKLFIRKRAEEIYMNGAKYDFALLKLSRNIERHKYFKLYQNLDTSPSLTVCGFNDQNTLKFHSNPPAFVNNGIICYDIDTIGGQSGSPVYEQKVNLKLVAIHKGFFTQKRLNIAVMITSELITVMEKWAVEMGVIFDVMNPTAVKTEAENKQIKIMQLTSKLEQSSNVKEALKKTLNENAYFLSNFSEPLEKQKDKINQLQNQLRDYQKRQADDKKTIERMTGQIYQLKIKNQSKFSKDNQVLNIQISSQNEEKGKDMQKQQFNSLIIQIQNIFSKLRAEKQQVFIQKDNLKNQLTNLQNQLNDKLNLLSQELKQTHDLVSQHKRAEDNYLNQISLLKQNNESLSIEIQRSIKIIEQKDKEKELQHIEFQFLQNSIHQIHNAELERERQYTIKSLFDARGCLNNSQQAFTIKQSIVQQIERINNKKVIQTRLLYEQSPQTKLQWTHFVNKPQFLMLIRTQNEKIIAIYSQSSIMKPPFSHDKREDIAFIFESNLKAEFAEFYPLLQGKSINGSYGNNVAFGKSDLRFSLGDTVIEGNFGYQGTLFDTKGKKIADLLGSSKVKMLSYDIYTVELGEQMELKTQNTKRYVNAEMQLKQRKVDIQINKKSDGEYDQQKAVLSKKITELEQALKEKNKQITIKSQQCEQLKTDIRLKQQNTPETQQLLLQSYTKYAEIYSSLQQSQAKYKELQKQKTRQTTVFNKAQKEIERFRTLQANLNSQIAVLSAKQSNSEQLATLLKTHEQQKQYLKTSMLKLQKEFAQTRKQRQQLNIKYKDISKAKLLLEMQVSELQLKVSNLYMKIEQYQYRQQGGGHTQQILLRENCEPNEQLSQLKHQVEQHRQSIRAKDNQINELTNEVDRINTANTEMTDENIESLNQITQLENKISRLDHQVKQLQSDNQSLVTKMAEKSLKIEMINSENEQWKKNNQSLEQKLTEAISLNEKANNQLGVNSQNLRLSQSAATQLQNYKNIAETYNFDPFLIAQYDKSFETQVLCGQLEHKITLIRHLQLRMHQTFNSARLVYRYDPHNATIYHKYIDGLDSLLCVVKTVRGVLLAGYYLGAYVQNEVLNKPGYLISITNNDSYQLHEMTQSRAMVFDKYYLIFGKAEILIRANDNRVSSKFGIVDSYFNSRNKTVHDLLGEGQNRQIELESYELYQIAFEKQEEYVQ